ncbi:hypothetical protein ACWDR6_12380, partial [Streptomyces ardesiacus]
YLMKPGVYRDGGLERTWRTKILPLLEEHHYGMTQAGHPDINIWGERLIVLAWLLPVAGVPLLLEPVVRGGRVPVPVRGRVERAEAVG